MILSLLYYTLIFSQVCRCSIDLYLLRWHQVHKYLLFTIITKTYSILIMMMVIIDAFHRPLCNMPCRMLYFPQTEKSYTVPPPLISRSLFNQ